MIKKHHYRSPIKRGIFSLLLVSAVMALGTVGIHYLESLSWIDALYFMSMIATAQGPVMVPQTNGGKIFVAFMSFLSVGSVVAALGFIFGPFFGQLWKIGVEHFEEEWHIKKEKE